MSLLFFAGEEVEADWLEAADIDDITDLCARSCEAITGMWLENAEEAAEMDDSEDGDDKEEVADAAAAFIWLSLSSGVIRGAITSAEAPRKLRCKFTFRINDGESLSQSM